MKELGIGDLPPSMQAEAFTVREQILQSLARSEQQRQQTDQMQRKLLLKTKRRIRKQQRRRHR